MVLVDERYLSLRTQSKLPDWFASNLDSTGDFAAVFSRMVQVNC